MGNIGKTNATELTGLDTGSAKPYLKGAPNGKGNESSALLTVFVPVGGQLIGGGSTTISNPGQTFPTGEF